MLRLQVPRLRLATAKCLQNHLSQEGANPRSVFSHLTRPLSSGQTLLKSDFSQSEIRACYKLFHRSGLLDPKSHRFLQLSSSILPRFSTCHFHSSSSQNSEKADPDDKKEKNDDQDKKNDDDDQIERLISMFKALIGFFLIPVMLLVVFSEGRGAERRVDPATAQPSFQQQQQTQFQQAQPVKSASVQDVTWTDFYHNMLMVGEVEEIVVYPGAKTALIYLRPDALYKGQRIYNARFRLSLQNIEDLEDRIRAAEEKLGIAAGEGMAIKYERNTENIAGILGIVLVVGLLALLLAGGRNLRSSISSMNPFMKMTKADFTLVDPQIRTGKGVKFSDVAGLREAKIEVKEFVDYLKHPEKYIELGARPPKGALLTGPPGCGKTMLAKAVANESNVPFLSMNGSEFIEMIGGLGAARVRNLFAEARKRSPSIIYIDEIDAIGRKRSGGVSTGGGTGEAEQTLNQLLVEMDGISSTLGVIMLASTNREDVLDRALLRPGRFDRHIMIDLPNVIERKEILEQHMKGVKLDQDPSKYSERLATLTPGFSGADLANVINEAALHAARINYDKVKADNLEYAIERVIAGPEKKNNMMSPPERKIVAYHESGHALVGWMLKHTDALLKVTILPRTSQALGFAQYTPTDKKLYSPEELMDRMCMALGGRVAESLTFNRITTGAQNDLEKVTKMAYAQIKFFGFNEKVGLLSFDQNEGGMKPYSKTLQATMDHEARLLIAEAYRKTEEVLAKHKDNLKVMAEALLLKETLNYDDVEKLLGPPPHGKKHLVTPVDFENSLNEQSKLGAEVNGGIASESH